MNPRQQLHRFRTGLLNMGKNILLDIPRGRMSKTILGKWSRLLTHLLRFRTDQSTLV
jgi:hypothetical protein